MVVALFRARRGPSRHHRGVLEVEARSSSAPAAT